MIHAKVVTPTLAAQLRALTASGDFDRITRWIVQRIADYEVQLDERGVIGHGGEAWPTNRLVSMLRLDYRAREGLPPLTVGALDHILRHAIRKLTEAGLEKLRRADHP